MNHLHVVLLCLGFFIGAAPVAEARSQRLALTQTDSINSRARDLLVRLKQPHKNIKATPLLKFFLSPENPTQNQNVSVFVQSKVTFQGRVISLDAKLDGSDVELEHPSDALWVLPMGVVTESKNYTLALTEFMENKQDNTEIRSAITALDSGINQLTNQINSERDAGKRKILQEQRAEKMALKNELIEQLKKLRTKVGTQNYTFAINPTVNDPSFPKITSLTPISGSVSGGTVINISGQNFTSAFSAKIGGIAASSSFVNANSVSITTPDFLGASGAKDIELRFSTAQGIKNVIAKNAFFAGVGNDNPPIVNTKPVAVAGGSHEVHEGITVHLDGSQSCDSSNDSLNYAWTILSAPPSSSFQAGQLLSTSASPDFSPDLFGVYVVQLVVSENATQDHYASEPSLAVVIVNGVPQPTIPNISVQVGGTVKVQANSGNPNPGHTSAFAITTPASHGTVSITPTVEISYHAGVGYVGADSFVLTVTDQSGVFGTALGSVTILSESGFAPAPSANAIQTHTEPGSTTVFANDPDENDTFFYQVLTNPQHGVVSLNSSALSSLASYTSTEGYVGTDSFTVRVTDNHSAFGDVVVSVVVSANSVPTMVAPAISIAEGTSGNSQVTASDTDVGQTGVFSIEQPAHGAASISAAGLVSYTPNQDFVGADSVTVFFTDNGNPGAQGSYNIPVIVNGSPHPLADPIVTTTGIPKSTSILPNDLNVGQSFTYTVQTPPANGNYTLSPDGVFTYTSSEEFTGSDFAMVLVADDGVPVLSSAVPIYITVNPNNAPVPTASSISALINATRTSQISANDPDSGQTFTYAITNTPSKGAATVSSSGLVTYVAGSVTGSDSIQVTVSDNGSPSLSGIVNIPVTILASNLPPVFNGGFFALIRSQGLPVRVNMGTSISITDPDGNLSSVTFDFGDGISQTLPASFGSAPFINHDYVALGDYTVTITARDSLGAETVIVRTAHVVDTILPQAKFSLSSISGPAPLTVTVDGSANIDPDGSITEYRWQWADGSAEQRGPTLSTATHTFNNPGIYRMRFRTHDNNGANAFGGTNDSFVRIYVGNTPPSGGTAPWGFFSVIPRQPSVNVPVTMDAGLYSFDPNPSGSIANYEWHLGDFYTCPSDGCIESGSANAIATHAYPAAAHFFPFVVVRGAGGTTASSANQDVFVVNQGQAPRAAIVATVASGVAPLTVNFSSSNSYDYDGTITNRVFGFGDGSPEVTGTQVSYTYQTPGVYLARLQVTDNDNNSAISFQMTTVNPGARSIRDPNIKLPPTSRGGELDFRKEKIIKGLHPFEDDGQDPHDDQKQYLTNACGSGSGAACYYLGKIYEQEGDMFVATHLYQRACTLGYVEACVN